MRCVEWHSTMLEVLTYSIYNNLRQIGTLTTEFYGRLRYLGIDLSVESVIMVQPACRLFVFCTTPQFIEDIYLRSHQLV